MATHVHASAPHEPKPPEHVKPVEDPSHRARITKLAGDFHGRGQSAFEFVLARSGTDASGRGREATMETIRQFREKAGDYSLGLYGYWSYARDRFSDSYIYRQEGKVAELNELLAPLKDTDARLEKQLKDWADATSPYGDTYDVGRIEEVGRDLSETLKIASSYLTNRLREMPKNEKENRDASFHGSMLLAVSGLAEHIGSRLGDLGSGKTVPNATLSNETILTMNRAGQDDAKFALHARMEAATEIREDLRRLTADKIESNLNDHYRIEGEIQKLKDTDPDYAAKLRELEKQIEDVGLVPFFAALDEHTGPRGDAEVIKERDRLKEIRRELMYKDLQPDDRKALLAERRSVLESLLPKLRTMMDQTANREGQKLKDYGARLQDNTDRFHNEKEKFWSKTKDDLLGKIEKLGGKEKRKLLDKAFSTEGFSKKVEDWIAILGDRNARPDKMQSLASDVVKTADTYIERINGVLKDADSSASLLQLKNELISALTAIKLSTAENLRFQFDVMHRFE